ncbi:MAB_1171c family putative transporter [Kitasatospora sp. NPDC059599]|uniref:MAB_1171c family putative transporter n=1 Tax=Kitasatospora sp. NPDC059599 TaxID=3346880 RepID=UPI0036918990
MTAINLGVCIALWAITIWRAPGAWRNSDKRSLWAAFFVLACEMCFSTDTASRWLDRTSGIHSVSALLKHAAAVTAAAFVLDFLADAAATSRPTTVTARKRPIRVGVVVPLATLTTMITLFVLADRPDEALDLMTTYPHDTLVLAYVLVWTTYFGWAMLTASRLSWQWSRGPGPLLLRRGLGLICLGTSIGIVYAAHRAAMLFFARFDVHPVPTTADVALNGLLALVPLLLISVGSTMPAYPKARTALRQHRHLTELYPLWEHLSEAVPHIRYRHKRHRVRDALDPCGIRDRLYRRTIEIRDAMLILNGHAPTSLRLRAADHVEDAGLTGPAATTAADACWLRAAREAHTAGLARPGSPEPPEQAGSDLDSEAHLLLSLSDAYFTDIAVTFARDHLERLGSTRPLSAGATP